MKENAQIERRRNIEKRLQSGLKLKETDNLMYDNLIKDIDNELGLEEEKEIKKPEEKEDNIFDLLTKQLKMEEEIEKVNNELDAWTGELYNELDRRW